MGFSLQCCKGFGLQRVVADVASYVAAVAAYVAANVAAADVAANVAIVNDSLLM
jgi:hypothetical protein